MNQLFKKNTPKPENNKLEKVKISFNFDKNKIEIFNDLKTKLEAQNFEVLSLNQAFENHLAICIKKMETALKPQASPNPAHSDSIDAI